MCERELGVDCGRSVPSKNHQNGIHRTVENPKIMEMWMVFVGSACLWPLACGLGPFGVRRSACPGTTGLSYSGRPSSDDKRRPNADGGNSNLNALRAVTKKAPASFQPSSRWTEPVIFAKAGGRAG
jgi:hypothetical protein